VREQLEDVGTTKGRGQGDRGVSERIVPGIMPGEVPAAGDRHEAKRHRHHSRHLEDAGPYETRRPQHRSALEEAGTAGEPHFEHA
jgi:hypothetical protein